MKWLAILLMLAANAAAHAHANGSSYLRVESEDRGGRLAATWDIAASDLQLPLELDADGDGVLTRTEIELRSAAIARFATERLEIRRGGLNCRLSVGELATLRREREEYLSLRMTGACETGGAVEVATRLFFGSVGYNTVLEVRTASGRFPTLLTLGDPAWAEPAIPSVIDTLLRFLREGIWHVLIGYDHILFLLLLMLPSVLRGSPAGWVLVTSRREVLLDLLKIVTAFTVAHSVTLGLAAGGILRIPVQPIEVAIAGSIVAAGLLNLFPVAARFRLPLAFGFGLIHGFGFANALQEIDANGLRLAPLLAGFNLGVEIAQLLIVAAILPILWLQSRWSRYATRLMPALSLSAAATGAVWLAGRL